MKISDPKEIRIEDFNYNLPDERIAKYPLKERDASKLLVYRNGAITDSNFYDLTSFLPQKSLLIFNNTKVIQARLHFQKTTGAQIEIFCLEPYEPNDYLLSFQQKSTCSWLCLIGNLKKWKEGTLSKEIIINNEIIHFSAERIETKGDSHIVKFSWDNQDYTFSELLEAIGELPIPPYLNRDTEEEDKQTYQTVYSKIDGSVAAPTAGLHFTPKVFESFSQQGIKTTEVTLHVGAGTFRPVKSEQIKGHTMHSEFISIKRGTIQTLLDHDGAIIAVGTTSVRTLESLYYIGSKIGKDPNNDLNVTQWEAYERENNALSKQEALTSILNYLDSHKLDTLIAHTQIIIAPGYQFKIVEGIVTNFHQPQSTLLLLVSAFIGDKDWKVIYNHALENNYRFLSYGDSSLLLNS
ncbi:S-adenosylmethionine:tRNA ribosyltransferase-isomerase [Dysgonomonas sp. Marseille-P4361]|uniref:S-adenosylmethionine:tRNA ribosyltransferase-isomerase n=1 Tax=Dysgonomonas sp. Marseille-P4361 TaxID=2161820 RepID=UPI000D54B5D8|nr:S-adenosylmethionine:tRNA ribosyltransferase-isomerase [Dysgonomonas sp. Marseille-P4361]